MEKKRILLIGTGGTIASEMGDNGLEPELTSSQLLRYVPDISGICVVDCIQLFSLDSTNIRPEHWLRIAKVVQECYEQYDGFVVSHGTDTMAYTAAGLSYLIQNSIKPIVLTGAQKPIGYETTDSKQNLRDAFTVAASELFGVMLVFNGKIIMGTRARKTHSKSFEAFSSINYPIVGMVQDGRILRYIRPESSAPTMGELSFLYSVRHSCSSADSCIRASHICQKISVGQQLYTCKYPEKPGDGGRQVSVQLPGDFCGGGCIWDNAGVSGRICVLQEYRKVFKSPASGCHHFALPAGDGPGPLLCSFL